jgi:hypothetical protein
MQKYGFHRPTRFLFLFRSAKHSSPPRKKKKHLSLSAPATVQPQQRRHHVLAARHLKPDARQVGQRASEVWFDDLHINERRQQLCWMIQGAICVAGKMSFFGGKRKRKKNNDGLRFYTLPPPSLLLLHHPTPHRVHTAADGCGGDVFEPAVGGDDGGGG